MVIVSYLFDSSRLMVRNIESDSQFDPPDTWSKDLLLRLDWKRLQELARAIVWTAGYRVSAGSI